MTGDGSQHDRSRGTPRPGMGVVETASGSGRGAGRRPQRILARISHHVSSGAPAWSRLGIPERPKPVTDRRSDRSGIQADGEKCGLAVGAEVTRPYGQGRQGLLTPTPTALREPQLSLFIQPPLRPPANCLIFGQLGAYDGRRDAIGMFKDAFGMFQDAMACSNMLLACSKTLWHVQTCSWPVQRRYFDFKDAILSSETLLASPGT